MVNAVRTAITSGILTLIIFTAGIFFGIEMQKNRVNEIVNDYKEMQISWNDIKLQSEIIEKDREITNKEICENLVKNNIRFGDEIYEKGKKIATYEKRNDFATNLDAQKREHNLLRLQFWLNSISIKKRCNNTGYVNVVYFYKDNATTVKRIEQDKISEILFSIKMDYGKEIMLIPIAIDLNLTSVTTALTEYNLTKFPCVFINENITIEKIMPKNEIEKIIDEQKRISS